MINLTSEQCDELIDILKSRFLKNANRHQGISWVNVEAKIKSNTQNLVSLFRMEETGGEPDVIAYDKNTDEYIFCDCSIESPKGRRSLCYDHAALNTRKEHKPINSAVNMASEMGIELLTELQYRELQKLGSFDSKTSSWVTTPEEIRNLGGALFCDFRYNQVFVYHNGAESYYGVRGFRGLLRI